jgi:acetylglutamate kinase
MKLQKYIDKAEVLIEALPYITKFNGKIIVIKYGGSAMLDEELKRKVIQDIVLLKMVGFKPIIVHGGGKEISKWVKKSGMEPKFLEGLRVTDEATIELVEMVLGKVNNELVRLVHSLGVKALGVSGMDGDLLKVNKKIIESGDIGYVGDVKQVNPQVIYDLLDDDYLPIIYPVGIGDDGKPYNINADEAAGAIATAIGAEKLAFLTDTEAVYMDINDPDSRISQLGVKEAQQLIEEGVIAGGMIPKIMNCVDAVNGGVNRVHILDGRLPHCVLLEIFTNQGIGTMVLNDEEVEE